MKKGTCHRAFPDRAMEECGNVEGTQMDGVIEWIHFNEAAIGCARDAWEIRRMEIRRRRGRSSKIRK